MNRFQRKILWTASLSHGLIHVYELAVPPLLLLIQRDFGVGDLSMGKVVTLYGLLFGVGALPAGLLVDRVGSKPLLLLCLWGSAVSVAGMALSPSLAWFATASACMGLFLSIYHPAGTALLSNSLPVSGRVFATHGMAGNTGIALSSVATGTLGALFGWRWALGVLAGVGVLLGLRVLGLQTPRTDPLRRTEGGGQWSAFVLLLVAVAFLGMVYRGVTTFLPKFFGTRLAEDASAGTALGGLFTTAAMVIGLVGMYVAGRLTDRHPEAAPRVFLASTVLQAPFLVALGYVANPALVPMAMAVSFFHFMAQPSGNYLVAKFTPPGLRGAAYGVYFLLSFGAGSLGAVLGGWVSERMGLAGMFPALAAVLLPAVLAMSILSLRGSRSGHLRGEA